MNRDQRLEGRIRRASRALGVLVKEYEAITGRRMTIFCESGSPFLIDYDRDDECCRLRKPRGRRVEDGGCVIISMPGGGAGWDGGGW